MQNSITMLLQFMSNGVVADDLTEAVAAVGEKNTRVILTEILSWIKRQHRFKHEKPLELRSDFTWCQQLSSFVELVPRMSELFEIDENQLRFRNTIQGELRTAIREQVFEGYQPVLRPLVASMATTGL